MPTDMLTTDEHAAPVPVRGPERVRRLRRNVAAYGLGMVFATAIWALVEWQDHGGPERFSGEGNPTP